MKLLNRIFHCVYNALAAREFGKYRHLCPKLKPRK